MTLTQAQAWLRNRVNEGERCPCCNQFAKVYRRKINSGMARALVAMYRYAGTDWLHKPTALSGLGAAARDESLLRYWSLIEEATEPRDDGGRAGWWRVTPHGEQFLLGHATVPKYVFVYDGRLLSLDQSERVSIHDALGDRFNYGDLMAGR